MQFCATKTSDKDVFKKAKFNHVYCLYSVRSSQFSKLDWIYVVAVTAVQEPVLWTSVVTSG